MGSSAKVLVGLLVLVTFISLGLAVGAGYLLKQEIDKRKSLEAKSQSLEAMRSNLDKNLQSTKEEVDRLQVQLTDANTQLAAASGELQTEKTNKDKLSIEINGLEAQLKQEKSTREDVFKQLEKAKGDLEAKSKELENLNNIKKDLEAKIKDLEVKSSEGVQLEKIVVKQSSSSEASRAGILEGKILSVNREYDFAIVNFGRKAGISVGDMFTVYNNKDKSIGKLKVEKVYEALSAANFLPPIQKDQIKEGCRVTKP
ncbi:MAG: hypothetical protein V1674_07185 [Candidatus Omnitrophota bacterium]